MSTVKFEFCIIFACRNITHLFIFPPPLKKCKNHSQLKSCAKIGSDWIWPTSQVDPWPGPLSSHFPALTANCHHCDSSLLCHCSARRTPQPPTRLLPLSPLPNKNSGVVGFQREFRILRRLSLFGALPVRDIKRTRLAQRTNEAQADTWSSWRMCLGAIEG